jgi:ankyrin repeat protein
MKIIAFIFALLLSATVSAGTYEDLEEELIRGDSQAVIALIKRGVDVNTVDRRGDTLLTQSVRRDLSELFDYLLQRRARLNVRNRNGETALSLAAYLGKLNYVQKLVAAGADVNLYGWSPLAYAAFNGHAEIADYLVKHGADVNAKTENGSTPLFFAARFGHREIAEMLLANKADPTIANDAGDTAVDWAMKAGNTEIEDDLRAAGARSGKSMTIDMAK